MKAITRALFLAIVGGFLFAGTAYAHAAYVRSNPGADAILAVAPARVEIWFAQELYRRKGQNTIVVTSPDGAVVSLGDITIDDDNRKYAWVDLQADLSPGKYTVEWKNLSLEDGHEGEGVFSFTIDPQAEETSTPMLDALPTGTETPVDAVVPTSTPAPVTPLPVEIPTEPAPISGAPCAASFVPLLGLVGIVALRWRNK